MKTNTFRNVLMLLFGAWLMSACSVQAAEPVRALAATDPAQPTRVAPATEPVVLPEQPAAATEAQVAGSPTPSRIEFAVENAALQIQVMGVGRPYHVYLGKDAVLGTDLDFYADAGHFFLDLGIRVKNLTSADVPLKWTDIYLVNKYQEKWYPVWGAYRKTNTVMDPLGVEILQWDQVNPDYDPDAHFYAAEHGYVRAIFELPRENLYYFFGFADLPLIEINWRYY